MRRDWKKYNQELIKRGEILISPQRKTGRPEKSRKGWIKLHVAFDAKRKKVVAIEITDGRVHDSQKAQELVEGAKREAKEKGKEVSKVRGNPLRDEVVRAVRRGKKR